MSKSFDGENKLSSQAETWFTITPSDDEDLPHVPKAVCVSSATGGNFTARGADGADAAFYGNPGQVIQIRPVRILATDLTEGLTLTALRT